MGRRGPKPKPEAVRAQKRAVRSKRKPPATSSGAAFASKTAGAPPAWLKKEGLKIWQRLAPILRTQKLLHDADIPAFARYCKHYARWLELQKRLDKEGDIYEIETASGVVRRADPAFLMADRLDRMMLALEDRFGLNPAERQRIFAGRSQQAGDLFTPPGAEQERRPNDPAAPAMDAAEPEQGPVGFLN